MKNVRQRQAELSLLTFPNIVFLNVLLFSIILSLKMSYFLFFILCSLKKYSKIVYKSCIVWSWPFEMFLNKDVTTAVFKAYFSQFQLNLILFYYDWNICNFPYHALLKNNPK